MSVFNPICGATVIYDNNNNVDVYTLYPDPVSILEQFTDEELHAELFRRSSLGKELE